MNKVLVLKSINDHLNKFGEIRGYKSKKHINEIQWINDYFDDIVLYDNENLLEKIWVLLNNDYVHHCPVCEEIPQFRNFNIGYSNHCKECGRKKGAERSVQIKRENSPEITIHKKCKECGIEFSYKSRKNNNTIHKEFCTKSCAQIFHHKNRSVEDENKRLDKIKQTNLEKYENEWVVNSVYAKNRTEEKLGVRYPFQRKDILDKCVTTLKNKTGYDYPFNNPATVEKMKKTKIEKYGDLLKPMYKYKEYVMPSGKIYKVQGNEPKALDILIKEFGEEDIIIGRKNIESETGIIEYKDIHGKSHIYYPDIFIKSLNKVIEVKSEFTYNLHKKINELKKEECLKRGFLFEFMILN
jgi:hypothetical protein